MNQATGSDRLLRMAPLVLRWSLAAILINSGVRQVMPLFGGETGQTIAASTNGVDISANWSNILGAGETLVGLSLVVGFLTRLTSLAVLSGIGYAGYSSCVNAGGETLSTAAQMFQSDRSAMLLMAAAFGSLLISGAGCVAFDGRKRRRADSALGAQV